MNASLVSVVVPVHNGAAHVIDTLKAIACQTHERWEIIVVDDGSTDGSPALIAACGIPVTLLQKGNGGVSSARNLGMRSAQGAFVSFVDQDDHWHPQHLQRQLRALAQWPEAGVVVSPYQHWYAEAGHYAAPEQLTPPEPAAAIDPDFTGWVYHQFLLDCWALTSATTIRLDVLKTHAGFDESLPFSEDWDLWLRLSRDTEFVKLNWPPVLYRQHAEQGSRTLREVDWRCRLLTQNVRAHGMASRDGRSVPTSLFENTLFGYEIDFATLHLERGRIPIGMQSILSALRRTPQGAPRAVRSVLGALKRRAEANVVNRKPL